MTRAEHRLSIARGLLDLAPDADVMTVIHSLAPADREHLRGQVGWVEAYDNAEGL